MIAVRLLACLMYCRFEYSFQTFYGVASIGRAIVNVVEFIMAQRAVDCMFADPTASVDVSDDAFYLPAHTQIRYVID